MAKNSYLLFLYDNSGKLINLRFTHTKFTVKLICPRTKLDDLVQLTIDEVCRKNKISRADIGDFRVQDQGPSVPTVASKYAISGKFAN